MTEMSGIDLYVGEAVEHASERDVLAALVDSLLCAGTGASIFANFHVGGRQVDFLIATDALTLVVEAKHFSRRVRGKVNGLWQMRAAGGVWKHVGNPYLQALGAKNALRDVLGARYGETSGYPDACVAVAPRLPAGSDVPPSDHKVAVVDLDNLMSVVTQASSLRLSRAQWADFARHLGLRQVRTMSAAWNATLLAQEALVEAYTAEVRRTYAPDVNQLKPDIYMFEDEALDAIGLADRIVDHDDDLLIVGPSGCGKTLLAKKITLHCLEHGYTPIFLQAKYFAGKLGESIDREIAMLGAPSARRLIAAAKAISSPVLLVLDGYNECPAAEHLVLTRSLAAAVRRYGIQLIISAQADIVRPDLLDARRVAVTVPGRALKAAIAGPMAVDRCDVLLESASSGLEADLIGRVGSALDDGASRYALFDAYARQKLGNDATDGIRFLASVAGLLIDRLAFSLSIRDLERLAETYRIPGDLVGRIFISQLVVRRSDHVSFVHELIFSAFAAESIVRRSKDDLETVLQALCTPKYRNARALILGAYDDERFVTRLLNQTADVELLLAASNGECGRYARDWITARCDQILEKMTSEAAMVRFSFEAGSWNGAGVTETSVFEWTLSEVALMATISERVWRGFYIGRLIDVIGVMDQSLSRGFHTLKDEARSKNVALRSGLFADAYAMRGRAGISKLMACIANNIPAFRASRFNLTGMAEWRRAQTPGQVYFLLTLVRFAEDKEAALPYVLTLLGEPWKYQAYHLQLALLDFVHFIRLSDDTARQDLIAALEALLPVVGPLIAGMVFESLEHLGALDDEVSQHLDTVRAELRDVLSDTVGAGACGRARRLYIGQFDHPYSSAYCEAIQELSSDDRKRLLTMACQGAESFDMFVVSMLQELVEYNDPSVAPVIARWLDLPAVDSFMPQEAIALFVWAHAGLGMLGVPLGIPEEYRADSTADPLIALGRLYYWIHCPDLAGEDIKAICAPAIDVLQRPDQVGAAWALYMVTQSMVHEDGVRKSVIERFPDLVREICRNALLQPDQQLGYFPHFRPDRDNVLHFAATMIGTLGSTSDLSLLRGIGEREDVGASAIKAIQQIESRIRGMPG